MILVNTERKSSHFKVLNNHNLKAKAFAWAAQFEVCCLLDSNHDQQDKHKNRNTLIAVGLENQLLENDHSSAFEELKALHEKHKDWLFGFLTYDLKNEVENLSSKNPDYLYFPKIHFFQPEVVIELDETDIIIHSLNRAPKQILQDIQNFEIEKAPSESSLSVLNSRISKPEYLEIIDKVKNHILEGDVYEMNFCQEFYIENAKINAFEVFNKLNDLSKAPFSCFYKLKNQYLLCASPERYLKKKGKSLISQPIKGTIKRGNSKEEDSHLRKKLFTSEKDRAENVMIVDLVRNDLARVCEAGSVKVEELFGIYPFEQVFQMISTVKGILKNETHFVDAIKNTFPMGSMTGAPKIMAMKLIEKYEKSKRGLYSGSVGYITPKGDFDFNVVIRSMLYNEENNYLSFQVGGAIVYDSIPEQEYEECLLKAKAILQVLKNIQ